MFKRSDSEIKDLFYKLDTRQSVADILEINEKSLRYFLYVKKPENLYTRFSIRKKNGDERIIFAPENRLKNVQRKLAYILSLVYDPKICAYGFIKNKNIIQNADKHCKRTQVLNIDLKDFFTQIHFGRVRGMLMKAPFSLSDEAATTISQIACYNRHLPQGAPSSPILTNMICRPLDNQLMRLSKNNRMTYTRYVDDITFSTRNAEFPKGIVYGDLFDLKIGKDLKEILRKNSFEINVQKVYLNNSSTRQEVTGLIVNKFPNVKREYTKNIRAILHSCTKKGILQTALIYIEKGYCKNDYVLGLSKKEYEYEKIVVSWFKNVLKGKILFVKQVKGVDSFTFLNLALKMNSVFNEQIFDLSILDEFNALVEKNTFVLKYEKGEEYIQGSAFLLNEYGLLTNYHVTESGNYFDVYKYSEFDSNRLCVISEEINQVKVNTKIDYALYNFESHKDCFQVGDSHNLNEGEQVKIIGYPNFKKGDGPYIQNCEITSRTNFMGEMFYTISGRVCHGASGGLVLNQKKEVVGLLKGGIESLSEESENKMQGFVPIHLVIEDIKKSE